MYEFRKEKRIVNYVLLTHFNFSTKILFSISPPRLPPTSHHRLPSDIILLIHPYYHRRRCLSYICIWCGWLHMIGKLFEFLMSNHKIKSSHAIILYIYSTIRRMLNNEKFSFTFSFRVSNMREL